MRFTSSQTLPGQLQLLLHGLVERRRFAHAVMAVGSGDGSFHWAGAAGTANTGGALMRTDTPFFIASIDKLLNATIALQLIERGRLEPDAPIATWLPPALTSGLHQYRGVDYSGRITIRHLMSHASGLPDWLEERPGAARSAVETVVREGDRPFGLEAVAEIVRRLKPHFPPQDPGAARPRVRYSDTNYILLAAVIEAVTRQPLAAVLAEFLFRPLGLEHTFVAGGSPPRPPGPPPATLQFGGRPLEIPRLLVSIGGIYSTCGDLLAFMRALVRGRVFAEPATFVMMQQCWNRFGFPFDRAALRAPGWPIEYGLGIMRFRLPPILTGLQPLPAVVGHTGSTGCWLFHCPAWDVFLAGTVDDATAGALPYRMVPRLLRTIRAAAGVDGRQR